MSDPKPLILLCSCGAESLTVDFFIEDEDFEGHLTFGTWWDQNRTWRERLRAIWTIARGKSHYFDAIILDREDAERVRDRIDLYLGQQVWGNAE